MRGDNGTVNEKGGLNEKGWLGGQMRAREWRARAWPGQALAFARSAEPRIAPTRRSVAIDAGLAAAATTASLVTAIYSARGQAVAFLSPKGLFIAAGTGDPGGIGAAAVWSAVVTTAPLALRRIRPLTAFWVIFLGTVTATHYINAVTLIAVVLAAYSAAAHSPFRGAALISVLSAGLMVTAAFPNTTPPLPGRYTALLVLIPAALVGSAVQVWQRRAGDSQARLQRVQAEHDAATARALAAERARIAGELHDVVTHNVSVMVVQTGAARRVLATSPGEATAALLAVEASGRAAMIELQHLLGLLSPVDGMQAQGGEPLRPQPGLDRLRPLIDRVTAVGLPVELVVGGRPRALPPGADLTAYRVVQEALTNVMKHAGQARTAVRLDYHPHELIIDVSDDGRAAFARARGQARTAAGDRPGNDTIGPANPAKVAVKGEGEVGGGRGLLGLRERVSLHGGEFDAGPRPGGGWRVTARLPQEPQPADGAAGGPAGDRASGPVPARP